MDAAVRLLETMAEGEDAVVALARGRDVDETRLRATLRATTFAVVPMENERGRDVAGDCQISLRHMAFGGVPAQGAATIRSSHWAVSTTYLPSMREDLWRFEMRKPPRSA